jgi:hypothetical protein
LLGGFEASKVPPMTTTHIQIDDVTPRIAYTATSGQTEFAIPFAFFEDADIKVYQNDTLKTLTTHYAVAGEGASDLATRKVILVTGATVGDSIVIVRDIAIERVTDFPDTGPFEVSSLNTALDRIIAILQQEQDKITRTLRLNDSDVTSNVTIPAAATRASKFLAFDAAGDPTVAATVEDVPVSTFMQTVLDDTTAAAARTTLGITDTTAYAGLSNWHFCR